MHFIKKIGVCIVTAWRLWKEMWQIIRGLYSILDLSRPCVSIFGGSRLKQDSIPAKQAYEISAKLVSHGISVLTGGGPGIMEASNCGALSAAKDHGVVTMGIGIRGLIHDQPFNKCAGKKIEFDYFFSRKWLLIHYSVGYIIFPGGLGTMDELSDLLSQMQTGKIPFAPVVLIDKDYWKSYEAWVNLARENHLLSGRYEPHITVTDDIDEAVTILVGHCRDCTI